MIIINPEDKLFICKRGNDEITLKYFWKERKFVCMDAQGESEFLMGCAIEFDQFLSFKLVRIEE